MQLSIFSAEEPLANPSASQVSEQDWLTLVATSCLPTLRLLQSIGPSGWFGRTSPVSFPSGPAISRRVIWSKDRNGKLTKRVISDPSSPDWANSGMGTHTGFLTLSTSEFPSDADVCSLSDVLETGELPQRYFLSATACRGILRRAAKRGKELPSALHRALTQVSNASKEPAAKTPTTDMGTSSACA